MRRCKFIVTALLLFLAIGVLVAWALRPARLLPITISFLGYTNDTSGLRFARFAVTNHGRATLLGAYCCSQTKADAEPPNDRYFPHEEYLRGGTVILTPGQAQIVEASMPTNQTAWRLSAGFVPDGVGRKFKEWYQRHSVNAGLIGMCLTRRARRGWYGFAANGLSHDHAG